MDSLKNETTDSVTHKDNPLMQQIIDHLNNAQNEQQNVDDSIWVVVVDYYNEETRCEEHTVKSACELIDRTYKENAQESCKIFLFCGERVRLSRDKSNRHLLFKDRPPVRIIDHLETDLSPEEDE